MSNKTCFVVMPIGDQELQGAKISADDLKRRYTDLIKEALLKARPELEVVRADEVAAPGGITTDIYNRLMHSDYVLVDITYPNPNVFYELGIRTACRPGTILIRAKGGPNVPFDVAGLRHIAYENTPSGLKQLGSELGKLFTWYEANSTRPDNAFMELAKLTSYQFPDYGRRDSKEDLMLDAMLEFVKVPELIPMLTAAMRGDKPTPEALIAVAQHPEVFKKLMRAHVVGQ